MARVGAQRQLAGMFGDVGRGTYSWHRVPECDFHDNPFLHWCVARLRVGETIPQSLPVQSGEWAGPAFLPRYSIREMESDLVSELCLHDSALVGHVTLCSCQLRAHHDVIYSSLVFLQLYIQQRRIQRAGKVMSLCCWDTVTPQFWNFLTLKW